MQSVSFSGSDRSLDAANTRKLDRLAQCPPVILASPYNLGVPNSRIRVFKGVLKLTEGPSVAVGPGAMALAWLPAPRLEFETTAIGVLGLGPDPVEAPPD